MRPSAGWLAAVAVTAATGSVLPKFARADISTDELQREIQKRDALIDQLAKRVAALEHEVHAKPRLATTTAPTVAVARNPAPLAPSLPAAPLNVQAEAAPGRVETPPLAIPSPAAPAGTPEPTEREIARALENTLVNQGGLLLSPWVQQFVPDLGVVYSSTNQLAFVAPGVVPGTTSTGIFTQNSHRWNIELGLGYRIGLPYGLQANLRVPFDLAQGEATFGGTTDRSSNAGGLGDISFGLEKQVLYEENWWPAIILNANYKAATGSSNLAQQQLSTFPFAVGTGSGFPSLFGGVTFQKRQDPLVFLANLEYYHNFQAKIAGVNQRQGDSVEVRLSPILAASPDTSLRVAWDTFLQQNGTVSGRTVPGSNETISFLEFGVGSNLSSRWFMDASVGIGLTHDSPSFRALVQFPFRF